MRPLQIFVQRARNDFEPVVGPRVPFPFASLLFACLTVAPDARPTATAARLALAALASQAGAWDAAEGSEAGGAGGRDNASGTALSMPAVDPFRQFPGGGETRDLCHGLVIHTDNSMYRYLKIRECGLGGKKKSGKGGGGGKPKSECMRREGE